MGQLELRSVDYESGKVDEVDINRARTVFYRPPASERIFDCVHLARKLLCVEACIEDGDLVEELQGGELGGHVDAVRLDYATFLGEAG